MKLFFKMVHTYFVGEWIDINLYWLESKKWDNYVGSYLMVKWIVFDQMKHIRYHYIDPWMTRLDGQLGNN